ncbi:MAG: hypothetical protein DRP87_04640 [Spirochaetes bacterium]|nr:MAG: hypothetical protein DRP87_04640 [Spirochaetota bacterium]
MHRSIVRRLLEFTLKHSILIIIIILTITVIFGFLSLRVKINPDVAGLIPKDERISRLMEKYGKDPEEEVDYLVLGVEAEDLFSIEKLNAYYDIIEKIEKHPIVRSSYNPFNLITFERDGKRLKIIPMSPEKRAPRTIEELEQFKERIFNDPFAKGLVISEDGKVLCTFFPTFEPEDHMTFMAEIKEIIKELGGGFKTYITGSHAFENVLREYLLRDLSRLLTFAIIIILVVYYLGFRAKRAAIITMSVVLFGTIWCIGFMSLFGLSISIVSIVTPPLVLTLGSSYCIHILNQYYRESEGHERNGSIKTSKGWIGDAVAHINKTVMMAAATTVIGLGSLLATEMAPAREFGIATSIGIIACALLSLFFIPAVLSLLKPPTSIQRQKVMEGILSKGLKHLSSIIIRWKYIIIAFLILVIIIFAITLEYQQYKTDVVSYFPRGEKVIQDTSYLTEKIGGFQEIYLSIFVPEGQTNYFLQEDVLKRVSAFEEKLEELPDISNIFSFTSYLKNLNQIMTGEKTIPENRGLILLLSRYIKAFSEEAEREDKIANVANSDFTRLDFSLWIFDHETNNIISDYKLKQLVNKIEQLAEEYLGPEIEAELWGDHLRFLSLSEIIERDQKVATVISLVLIFLLTSVAFRSIRFGLFSLIPLLTGIMLNFIFMVIAGIPMDMTTVMFSIVVIGVGVDNSIHFLIQFRHQRELYPGDLNTILSNTLTIAGRPIMLTTSSIVGGLLVFCFASFQPIIYFGLLVAMALFTAALGTLVILPVFLTLGWRAKG